MENKTPEKKAEVILLEQIPASEAPQDVSRQPSRASVEPTNRIVILTVVVLSILWPAAFVAFLLGLLGLEALLSLAVQWKAAIGVGALFPLPAIWLTAYTWVRARNLSREARFLSRQAERLIQPDQTAAREIATIGMAVRREVDGLSVGMDAALAKVQDLEAAVQRQSSAIESAAIEAENRATELRRRMERERDNLNGLADELTKRADLYSEKITSQAEWVRDLSKEADAKFTRAATDLDQRSKEFSGVSSNVAAQTQKMGVSLNAQSEHLREISERALERSGAIAERYERQREDIDNATERLNQQNARLEHVLENQRDVLAQIAIVIDDQSEVLQASVAKCADDLQGALDKAVHRASQAAEQFQEEVEATTQSSNEAVQNMVKAAEHAGQTAEVARTALDEESKTARQAVEQQAAYAKEMVNGLFASFESTYREKAHSLQSALGEETGQFKIQLEETNAAAQSALSEQAQQAFDLVAQTTSAVDAASSKLGEVLETLQSTSLITADSFAQTAEKIESHVEHFPEKADAAALHIRTVLDEELNAFARLAEEAGRKIQTLSAAYSRHLPGVRAQTAPPAGGPSPYFRTPNYQSARVRHSVPSSATETPGANDQWAWRELLANIEPPAADPATPQVREGQSPPTRLSEDDLNKSALLVFESLQSMAIDIDRALESDPPSDLLRRYLNGEKALFTKRIVEMTSPDISQKIHDRYLEDQEFCHNVNQYIEQFEGLLGNAVAGDHEDILLDTFLSSHTGKVYLLLGSAVGHFG
jgi:hypothetical protein